MAGEAGLRRSLAARMTRFLAIYHGAAGDSDKQQISADQQSRFLAAWGSVETGARGRRPG
jgi:hypothetical protein